MIIRIYDGQDTSLMAEQVQAPEPIGCAFGRINLLMFTSAELRERYRMSLAETDFTTAFELVRALGHGPDGPTDAAIRKRELALLLEARPALLPCFVAYQQTPEGAVLPVMTDGHGGQWSLFFDVDGAMTLVECRSGAWRFVPEAELVPENRKKAGPLAETKGFLLDGIRSAKKILVRSDDSA